MITDRYDFHEIIEDSSKKLVLVIYDIIDNRRRTKMVQLLESYGMRVQKSAFEVLVSDRGYSKLTEDIGKIMSSDDNVRIYRLNSSNEVILLGTSVTAYHDEVILV